MGYTYLYGSFDCVNLPGSDPFRRAPSVVLMNQLMNQLINCLCILDTGYLLGTRCLLLDVSWLRAHGTSPGLGPGGGGAGAGPVPGTRPAHDL